MNGSMMVVELHGFDWMRGNGGQHRSPTYDPTTLELLRMRILRLRSLRGIPGMFLLSFLLFSPCLLDSMCNSCMIDRAIYLASQPHSIYLQTESSYPKI